MGHGFDMRAGHEASFGGAGGDVSARPAHEELAQAGATARSALPPTDLGSWKPAADRPDPVDLLEDQSKGRIPELIPVRYGRMAVSPFTFYRGAALPMAADLAPRPTTGIIVQLCGDAHLSNFGLFASPERSEVFDINDFDETLRGPFEWDLHETRRKPRCRGSIPRLHHARRSSCSPSRDALLPRSDGRVRDDASDRRLLLVGRGLERHHLSRQAGPADDRIGRPQRDPPRLDPRAGEADGDRRRPASDRGPSAGRGPPGRRDKPARDDGDDDVQGLAPRGSPGPVGPLRDRRLRAEGGRRRERRPVRDGPAPRRRVGRRSAVPPGQGGAGLGLRAVPRAEQPADPRRPGGRRSTSAPGGH